MKTSLIKSKIIQLRNEGKSYNEIKEIVKCSKSTISYFCRKAGLNNIGKSKKLNDYEIEQILEFYKTHTLKETSNFFNVSRTTILKHKKVYKNNINRTEEEKRKSNYIHVKDFRVRIKERAVEYMGGKCVICGYFKCIKALEFHHINKEEKDFTIGSNTSIAWERVKNEIKKCILVCANCHREIHDGLTIWLGGGMVDTLS